MSPSSSSSLVYFRAIACRRTLATHVLVGMGAASFWRGAWYVLDDNLFPDNPVQSAIASWTLGVAGLWGSQGLVGKLETLGRLPRLGAVYGVATSCVLVWRGTWVGWDCFYEWRTGGKAATDPGHATRSGAISHSVAVLGLVSAGLFTSILAPPAAVSIIRDTTVRGGLEAATRRIVQGAKRTTGSVVGSSSKTLPAGAAAARLRTTSTTLVRSTAHRTTTGTALPVGRRTSFATTTTTARRSLHHAPTWYHNQHNLHPSQTRLHHSHGPIVSPPQSQRRS